MERAPRRYLAWAVTGGAALVIAAAAASGVFQIAVQAVPGYRADVERYVREVTGRPVRIAALSLTWRYYYPSLELLGVALLSDDGEKVLLQAERLRLGFGLTRLLRGEYMPNRLELHGLALDAHIDRDGQVRIKGIETGGSQAEPLEALKPLTQFAELRLERCRLNLRDDRRRGETYSFGIARAELDRGLLGDAVRAEVTLPASIGDAARFDGTFTGELLDRASWSGAGTLELTGLNPASWLAPFLVRGAQLEMEGLEARVRSRLENGRLADLDVTLKAGAILARRARHEAAIEALEARVAIEFLADGWKAELRKFALETAAGSWPATQAEVRATTVAGEPGRAVYDAQVAYLRLADLAPWLQMVPAPAAVAALDKAAGEVRDLQLRVQTGVEDARYSYRARFEELALPAEERAAGFSGLRGEVAGDERGGRAVLQEGPVTLEFPGLLVTPTVPLEALEAEVEWRRLADAWQLGLPQFRWEVLGTRGSGRVELLFPDERERSPEIDLSAKFHADDVTRAKPLMPQRWGTGLRSWLDRSIVSGRAPGAELTIKGPLADFPFQQKPTGSWALDIEAQDILLAYQPDWPPVENLAATLKFRGNGLHIESTQGIVNGNPIKTVTAKFPDFRTGQLLIDGTVAGETAQFYDFLAKSPLRDTFKGLLSQTTASGPSAVEIHLDMPVAEPQKTKTSGRVTLGGVELRHGALPQPVRDIRGQVAFDAARISADKLTARLYELPLEARLTPQSADTTLLTAGFRFAIDPAGKGASELVPTWVRKQTVGASDWRAEFVIGGRMDAPVKLSTDLVGVEVRLPPPLGKTSTQAVPLTVTVGGEPKIPVRITVDYLDRFGADLRFARPGETLVLERGALRLGGGPLIPAEEKGLVIGGGAPEIDMKAWVAELQGGGIERQMETIKRADLHIGRVKWDNYTVRDARYQWTAQKDGWSLSMIGAGAIGEARWLSADRGTLTARMDQLVLDSTPPAEAPPDAEPLDPVKMPLFDLDVRRLALNQSELGHVAFATARSEAGQRLKTLKVDGGSVNLTADGEWRRRAGQSSANLTAELATTDIAALLRAFHYAPNLDAKSARFRGAVAWPPSEHGVEWHQAQGNVHLEFENGQLRAVEPGAGRVLGLVNFYALPRRLTLNFRDVVSSGLGFDKVNGDFDLRDGNARTGNLTVTGPSVRMEMKGRIGLAARDYDQQVTVYPSLSAGVTLGAALLGGPIAGVLTFIAQEVLKKPLNQVTQLTYRLTGSWDNPQVERASGPLETPEQRERQRTPPSQKP